MVQKTDQAGRILLNKITTAPGGMAGAVIRELKKKASKYRNKRWYCLSCHLHDSQGEANYCNRLLAMKQAGEIRDYQVQVRVPLTHGIDHVVDFLVAPRFDRITGAGFFGEVHEYKGCETPAWRIKAHLFQIAYPGIKYFVIKRKGGFYERKEFGVRSKKGSICDHGPGLKSGGVCVICRRSYRQKG